MRIEQIIPEQIQGLIDLIESQTLTLAEVPLPDIAEMPDYSQVLRVEDNIIALSQGYLKVNPVRVLIHKTTGTEIKDMNLPVPDWERRSSDLAALVDEATGERMLFETNYYEMQEDPESPGQMIEVLVNTEMEPYHVPVLQYLKLMITAKPYSEVFETFTMQYIADVEAVAPGYFSMLRPPDVNGLIQERQSQTNTSNFKVTQKLRKKI